MEDLRAPLESLVGGPLERFEELAANKYCRILSGSVGGERIVMKAYNAGDPSLSAREAEGIRLYERISAEMPSLIPARVVASDPARRLLAMSFVPGRRLADVVRECAGRPGHWGKAEELLKIAGEFLRQVRMRTLRVGDVPDPFHAEYLAYSSGRLRDLPVVGSLLFAQVTAESAALWDAYRRAGTTPSTAHGDFVLRNLHVEDGRIGVIDFANTLVSSHPLNDLLNMRQGFEAMWLPPAFRQRLWRALLSGFDSEQFPEADRAFFHEFHRRRWLMLNLGTLNPVRLAKVVRGMRSFARPWEKLRQEDAHTS